MIARSALVLVALSCLCLPAAAQELRLSGDTKSDLLDKKTMEKKAEAAARGYYDAMIKGDYPTAATFVHPHLVSTLKDSMGGAIRKLKPGVQKKALEKIKLDSLSAFDNLTHDKFFTLWAGSDYGYAVATLSNPDVEAKYRIEAVRCALGSHCDVFIEVRGRNEGGKINASKSAIRAEPALGNWRVGAKVPVHEVDMPSNKGPKLRKAQREKLKKGKKGKKGK